LQAFKKRVNVSYVEENSKPSIFEGTYKRRKITEYIEDSDLITSDMTHGEKIIYLT
jgi:hypothetical protein